jgi:murein DD-endopeptidase MepM/ murein hydrolase activator NlpD
LIAQALAGRRPPELGTVNVAAPFANGTYIVAHGGSTETVNAHLHTLDRSVERFRPWRGQSLAVDIIRISPLGLRTDGWRPTNPARYATFGTPLLAPCAGTVAVAVDGLPDMPVPEMDREHLPGNFVMIDCGDFAVALAHMRQGSVLVEVGDQVQVGDPIGEMGNSGNSSEPHLHFHAQRGIPEGAPFGGEPLGLTIGGRFLVRNHRIAADT